jgi:LmbE family N-acetylglucosaminyl deacetylase
MKLTFDQSDRVLAVMAHPDDAELLCAGTLARARGDASAVAICVMCRGDKGVGSSSAGRDAATVRREEAAAAAELLGAKLFWFNAGDGELFDTYDQRRALIEIYRQFRPTLVLAHSPEDYHADHRAASALAEAASWFAASRGHVTDSPALDAPPALWFCDTIEMAGFTPELYVDVSPQVSLKRQMLECHRSQLERGKDKDFAPLAELMLRQAEARGRQAGVPAAEAVRQHHAFKRTVAF